MRLYKWKNFDFIGANFHYGQKFSGVSQGPEVLRKHGIRKFVENQGYAFWDYGNLPTHDPVQALQILAKRTHDSSKNKNFCFTAGGDHSIGMASVLGVLKTYPNLRVLWVDAHADCNTPETSPTGSLHGMPVASLLGRFPFLEELKSKNLHPSQIVLFGVRDMDPGEEKILKELEVKVFTKKEIDEKGVYPSLYEALSILDPWESHPLHLSFDLDAMDPSISKATGVPVEGGFSWQDLKEISKVIAKTSRLVSMDFVELNPDLAENLTEIQNSVQVCFEILHHLFEEQRHQQQEIRESILKLSPEAW